MPIGTILSTVFSKAASAVVDSVGNAFDKNFTTDQERQQCKIDLQKEINHHLETVEAEATKSLELELKDMSDARNREIQIATSEHAPYINKVIQPVLAILILGSCFLMWYIIIFREIPDNKRELIAGIVGSLTTISMGVVQYFFGSSTGSKAKAEQIDVLMQQKAK